jgi:hypothetical protein
MYLSSGRMRLRSCTQCFPQSAASQILFASLPKRADVSSTAVCIMHHIMPPAWDMLRARRQLIILLLSTSSPWFHPSVSLCMCTYHCCCCCLQGRNVVLESKYGSPKIVNDGVTIAKEVELEDPVENIGAKLVRQAAARTNDTAGDGTTTATILSAAFIAEGLKIVAAGAPRAGAMFKSTCSCV